MNLFISIKINYIFLLSASVNMQVKTEQEEEFISNTLLKKFKN